MAETLRYLDGSKLKFFRPEGSPHLRVELEDECCLVNARVKRAFPLSTPEQYYSVQDGANKELGLLRTLDDLDSESRKLVEMDLDRRYFTPKILAINSLRRDGGMWTFGVQTQRGPAEFYVRNWRDSAHEIAPNRWQIHSVDGQRFEVQDATKLDARSQNLLQNVF